MSIAPGLVIAAMLIGSPALAQTADPHAGHTAGMVMPDGSVMPMAATPKGIVRRDAGPVEAALQAFSDALAVGNRDLAIDRLAADAVIVENGAEESRADYLAGHLAADIAFQKTVRTILLARTVASEGAGRARISSTIRMISNRSDKAIDITVAETAIIEKRSKDWKIVRLEWQPAR